MNNGTFGVGGFPESTSKTTAQYQPTNYSAKVTLGENCQKGDLLVCSVATGNAVPLQFPSSSIGQTYLESSAKSAQISSMAGCSGAIRLSNGNYAINYVSVGSGYPEARIIDGATGANLYTVQTIDNGNAIHGNCYASCALSGGGFAVMWASQTDNYVYAAIVSNTGTMTVSKTGLGEQFYNTTGNSFSCAQLSNGNIVFCYPSSSGNNRFIIRNSTTLGSVVAATNTEAGSDLHLSVAALTGGGFVVAYRRSSTNSYPRFIIFNNSGTVVTAATDVNSESVESGNTPRVISLASGGFAVFYWNSPHVLKMRAYNSTGTATIAATTIFTPLDYTISLNSVDLFGAVQTADGNITVVVGCNGYANCGPAFMVVGTDGTVISRFTATTDYDGLYNASPAVGTIYSVTPITAGPSGSSVAIATYAGTTTGAVQLRVYPTTTLPAYYEPYPVGFTTTALTGSGSTTLAATVVQSASINLSGAAVSKTTGVILSTGIPTAGGAYGFGAISSTGTVLTTYTGYAAGTSSTAYPTGTSCCALSDGSFVALQVDTTNGLQAEKISENGVRTSYYRRLAGLYGGVGEYTYGSSLKTVSLPNNQFAVLAFNTTRNKLFLMVYNYNLSPAWGFAHTVTCNSAGPGGTGLAYSPTTGNLCFTYLQSTGKPVYSIVSLSGAVVLAETELTNIATTYMTCTGLMNGNFMIHWTSNSTSNVRVVSPTGTTVASYSFDNRGSYSYPQLASFQNGGAILFGTHGGTSSTAFILSDLGVPIRAITISPVAGSSMPCLATNVLTGGVGIAYQSNVPYPNNMSLSGLLQPVIGVAESSGAAGSSVNVITQGVGNLRTGIGASARAFDFTGCTPAGVKGSLVGSTAILKGF
jgi:predicted lipoprotein with Yx(FWY)xxD motif